MDSSDYLKLNQFYQARADSVKTALYTSVTWVAGFATAILGIVATRCFELIDGHLRATHAPLAVVMCIVGGLICALAIAMVRDGARHIKMNWTISNRCSEKVDGLRELIEFDSGARVTQIWVHMEIFLFGLSLSLLVVGISAFAL